MCTRGETPAQRGSAEKVVEERYGRIGRVLASGGKGEGSNISSCTSCRSQEPPLNLSSGYSPAIFGKVFAAAGRQDGAQKSTDDEGEEAASVMEMRRAEGGGWNNPENKHEV